MGAWDLGHQRGSVSFFAFCVRPVYMYKLHDEQGRKASVFFFNQPLMMSGGGGVVCCGLRR
jgi:hypothetical protein